MKRQKKDYPHPFAPTDIPTGKHFGALPDKIFINGIEWRISATAVIEGVTYDRLINTVDQTIKKVERMKLINFLIKNQQKSIT